MEVGEVNQPALLNGVGSELLASRPRAQSACPRLVQLTELVRRGAHRVLRARVK